LKLTHENPYNYGTCYETYGYQSNGDADDWSYTENLNRHKILSITAESGSNADGFWPQSGNIDQLCKEAISIDLAFSKLCLEYAQISDLSSSIITQPNGYLHYSIECLGLDTPSTFTVSFTPISSDITFASTPATFSTMYLLDKNTDSISYTLNCAPGSSVTFLRSVNNGIYTYTDTITKYYYPAATLLFDSCNTMVNWTSNDWGITNTSYFSPSGSITDSPSGNYSLYQTSEILYNTPVDLQNAAKAVLNFRAQWNMENNFDYVELFASSDNGTTWSPLCGNHSEQGSANEDLHQPVYDAMQLDWIYEEVPLDDYLGNTILLKFIFKSNLSNNRDGFYLDDFEIKIADSISTDIKTIDLSHEILVYPNPANQNIFIHLPENKGQSFITVQNAFGQKVYAERFADNSTEIALNTALWSEGIYFVTINSNKNDTKKIVVIH